MKRIIVSDKSVSLFFIRRQIYSSIIQSAFNCAFWGFQNSRDFDLDALPLLPLANLTLNVYSSVLIRNYEKLTQPIINNVIYTCLSYVLIRTFNLQYYFDPDVLSFPNISRKPSLYHSVISFYDKL